MEEFSGKDVFMHIFAILILMLHSVSSTTKRKSCQGKKHLHTCIQYWSFPVKISEFHRQTFSTEITVGGWNIISTNNKRMLCFVEGGWPDAGMEHGSHPRLPRHPSLSVLNRSMVDPRTATNRSLTYPRPPATRAVTTTKTTAPCTSTQVSYTCPVTAPLLHSHLWYMIWACSCTGPSHTVQF